MDARVGVPTDGRSASSPLSVLGRTAELAAVSAAVDRAVAGSGSLVLVEGPAGIGKTAFADAAAAAARSSRGAVVVWGRCWEDGSAPAYWPWSQVMRALVVDPAAHPALSALLAPSASASASPGAREDGERFVLFDAVAGVLARAAREAPLLVVLEDLHAADVASLVLLRFAVQQLRATPCVVLGTVRTGEASGEVAEALAELTRDAEVVPLTGLADADLAALVEHVVDLPASPQLVGLLRDATEGNPYHAREVLRLLRAEGALSLAWDRDVPLPASVGAAVLRRLAPLGEDVRHVLEAAAVLGREFDLPTLARVADRSVERLLHAVDVAAAHSVVAPLDRAPGRVGFVHALARDAIYSAIPPGRRAALHGAAGEALLAAGTSPPALLAHHFTAAAVLDDGRRGFTHTVGAVDDALARHGYEQAAALARQALELAPLASPPRVDVGDVHVRLGAALMMAGDLAAGRAEHLRAVEIARQEGDRGLLARAVLAYGNAPVEGGQVDHTLVGLLEEALEQDDRDDGVRARLLARLAHELLFSPADVDRRGALGAEALALVTPGEDDRTEAEVLRRVIGASIGPDSVDQCLALTEQLLAVSRRAHAPELEAEALARRCTWLLELGRAAELDGAAERVAELAERLPQPQVKWFAAVLGIVRKTMRGQLEDAAADRDRTWQAFPTLPNAAGAWAAAGLHASLLTPRPAVEPWEGLCRSLMQSRPGLRRSWGSGLAALLAQAGRRGEAEELLRSLVAELADVPRDGQYVVTLAWAAVTASELADAGLAAPVLDALEPFSGRHVCVSMALPVAYVGPVDHYLGRLAATLGRYDDAERWLASAVASAFRLDAPPWVALSWLVHAGVLEGRAAPGDAQRAASLLRDVHDIAAAVGATALAEEAERRMSRTPREALAPGAPALVDEGDVWAVTYAGRTTRHRASKAFRYLAVLLAQPGREVHVLDLVAAVEGGDRSAVAVDGDVGPVLDERARAEYRARLEQLRDDLTDAEADGDTARAARARTEFEFLTDELRRALGLGGRDRRSGGHAEQARSSVTKLLRRLLERLDNEHPELARHLRGTLHTGYFCSYADGPSPALEWRLR